MRTNGFALFRGPGAREKAQRAATKVQRYNRRVVLEPEPVDGEPESGNAWYLAHALEEGGAFPLVHGFAVDEVRLCSGGTLGEFSFVTSRGGHTIAGRDPLGTRALYLDQGGTCITSDHRFISQKALMLPRGGWVDLGSGDRGSALPPTRTPVRTIEEAAETLCRLLDESVARRVKGRKRVAVSFSGGLDSSIIAHLASRHAETVLCSAYTTRSGDRERTAKGASQLGLEFKAKEIGPEDAARELRALDLPFEAGPMDKALWCLYSTTSRLAAENHAEVTLLGQLADELFGGYMKYSLEAKKSEASAALMMERDVAAAAERGFVRDEQAVSRFGEVRFPFADQEVAGFAMGLPLSYKIARGERKAVLRMSASLIGLPDELARAPKKAAQYSSGILKLVE